MNNMVRGLKVANKSTDICIACVMGKQCKISHPQCGRVTAHENSTVIHFDTFDATHPSVHGIRYMVVAVDEFSNYRICTPVKAKSDAKNVVKVVVNQVELESKRTVARIVSDQGTEFLNNDLKEWLAERGVDHMLSTAYTPQQNGVAERAVRVIKEAARTQLVRSKLPATLWAESALTATYALNRAPSPRCAEKTRFELYWGYTPDVSNLKVFGQYSMVKRSDYGSNIWEGKSKLGRFVGYTNLSNTYRMYIIEDQKVRQVCDVKFLPLDFEPERDFIDNLPEAMEIDLDDDEALLVAHALV